jgi:DNA-binding NarL/FixJ family response regulator
MVSTVFGDEAHVLRSIECGASGYLLKDEPVESMAAEIRNLHKGGSPISPLIARQVLMRLKGPAHTAAPTTAHVSAPELSANEMRTLELIAKGFTAEEIAELMGVARSTVQTYVRRVYLKLKVNSRTEAIYEARFLGLVPP